MSERSPLGSRSGRVGLLGRQLVSREICSSSVVIVGGGMMGRCLLVLAVRGMGRPIHPEQFVDLHLQGMC